jgi:methyl-accepting chemotaxis protein
MSTDTTNDQRAVDGFLRLRIFLLVAIPLAVSMTFTIIVEPSRQATSLQEAAARKATSVTNLFGANAVAPIFVDDPTGLEQLLETAQSDEDVVYAVGYSAEGKLLGQYARDKRGKLPSLRKDQADRPPWEADELLHAVSSVRKDGKDIGYVQAGYSLKPIRDQTREFRISAIALSVLVLLIAVLVAIVLGRGFAALFDSLRGSILKTARQVDDVVNQLAAVTAQQTAAASEESSALHESNATAVEVGTMATSAARRAAELVERGGRAETSANAGLDSATSAIKAMREVREQMATIGNTISQLSERAATIGEIASTVAVLAERSNLLALNAAIEAARAGVQGRGFAVVAQEMRSLADGSNRSAGQVKDIIGEIQTAIARAVADAGEGARRAQNAESLADHSGESIRRFVEATNDFAKAGKDIAHSAGQQSSAIEQMVESIGNATEAGGTQLETTRQVEATARQLRQLSRDLLSVVVGTEAEASTVRLA